jgi:hypothetical protein
MLLMFVNILHPLKLQLTRRPSSTCEEIFGTSLTIQEVLLEGEGRLSRKATVTLEDRELLVVKPLSSVPLSSIPTKIVHLSNSEGDNPLYINQILKDVAFKRMVEKPLAVVVLELTKLAESLEPNHSRPMDVGPPTIEDTLMTEEKGEEAQRDPVTTEATKSREKSSIGGQVVIGIPHDVGSVSGHTPKSISWLFGEPLPRLGDNWLGNSFIALAGLIPAPSSADDNSLPPKETMENMLYHLLDVSISTYHFICIITSKISYLFSLLIGFHEEHGVLP